VPAKSRCARISAGIYDLAHEIRKMASRPLPNGGLNVMRFDPGWRLQRSASLALIATGAVVLVIAAARLLMVAGYSTATASALVSSDGYVNALPGPVLPVVALVLPYLALVLLLLRRFVAGSLAALSAALISPARMSGRTAATAAGSDWHQV